MADPKGTLGKWGPEVIGQEQYEREKHILRTGAWKYGPEITGEPTPVKAAAPPAPKALSFNEMRALAKAKGLHFEGTPSKDVLAAALAQ